MGGACGTAGRSPSDAATMDGADVGDSHQVDARSDAPSDVLTDPGRDGPFELRPGEVQPDSAISFCTSRPPQASEPCRIDDCRGEGCDVATACQAGGRLLCEGRMTCSIVAGPSCQPACEEGSSCTLNAVGPGVNVWCNRVEQCTMNCNDTCLHQCAERSTCKTELRGGKVSCGRNSQCNATCLGPACSLDCWWYSTCVVASQGDGATINCRQGSTCTVECGSSPCNLFCEKDAICKCSGPGCNITNPP